MRQVLITESSLRGLLRELMNSHAPIHANPVVDPQAAETDPTNQNFVPTDKMELMSALRMLVSSVDDEEAPEVYVAIKDAVTEKDEEMKKDSVAESIIRQKVRKILKEAIGGNIIDLSPSALKKEMERKKREASTKTLMSFDLSNASDAEKFEKVGLDPSSYELKNDIAYVDLAKVPAGQKSQLISIRASKAPVGASGRKGSSEEERLERYQKDVASLQKKFEALNFLDSGEKQVVEEIINDNQIFNGLIQELDKISDNDVKKFISSFNSTKDLYSDLAQDEELSQQEIDMLLSPTGIINSKQFDKSFGQNFNNFAESKGKAILNSLSKKGYFSTEGQSLSKIGQSVGLSVSGVKKESNIALGKYIITLKVLANMPSFMQYLDDVDASRAQSAWDPEKE